MATSANTPKLAALPGQGTSLAAAITQVLRNFALNTDQMLPAIIESYDRKKNVAAVRPIIAWVDVNNGQKRRPIVYKVPVLSLGGGGFHINFPLRKGDLGWIIASDRDISLFKNSLTETVPNTGRVKSFADGMLIPDVMRQYTINDEDEGAMVIQSTSGETRISIRGDNMKITAPVQVVVDTPLTKFTGSIEVAKDTVVIGNTTVSGMTNVNGGFSAAGGADKECSLPATATVDGINMNNHGHEQNGVSGRTSGGMVS